MRHFDLSPLYRSTVGFDRLFSLFDQPSSVENSQGYPPYNIERIDENSYRVTLAVAGFSREEISIETRENTLTVRSIRQSQDARNPSRELLYQGIAARSFERRFELADHVQATGAHLSNGLLHIDLYRQVPEAQRPRQIPIADKASEDEAAVSSTDGVSTADDGALAA